MNQIGNEVKQIYDQLMELWKENNPTGQIDRPDNLSNFYDLLMELWVNNSITDSRLAMDLLKFYFEYKRFWHEDPSSWHRYNHVLQNAINEKQRLLGKL